MKKPAKAFTLVALTLTASVAAEPKAPTPERCGATFRARLRDSQQAVKAHLKFREAGKRAISWWGQHCRPANEDDAPTPDPTSFVCDTQKGRPPGLTPAKLREYMSDTDIAFFQKRLKENQACAPSDPISLDMTGLDTEVLITSLDGVQESPSKVNPRTFYQTYARIIEVRCHDDASKACVDSQQSVEDLRKKVEALEAERTGRKPPEASRP